MWDWWVEHGFEALLGGVLAGLSAGLAVWLTLDGNRRQGEVNAAEVALAQLQGACITAYMTITSATSVRWWTGRVQINLKVLDATGDAGAAAFAAHVRLLRRWPGAAGRIEEELEKLSDALDKAAHDDAEPLIGGALLELQAIAGGWLRDHAVFES